MIELILIIGGIILFGLMTVIFINLKRLERKLDFTYEEIHLDSKRLEVLYVNHLYSVADFFVKNENYEEADRIMKVINLIIQDEK